LLKQICLLVLESIRDGFFQLFYCRLFGGRSHRLKPGGTWTRARTLLAKANGSSCDQTETTKNELSFHKRFLGQTIGVVDCFLAA